MFPPMDSRERPLAPGPKTLGVERRPPVGLLMAGWKLVRSL